MIVGLATSLIWFLLPRFFGGDQGFRALHIALQYDLRPASLRRYYSIINGEPVGPEWEMTFSKPELPN
jgi:hypothetical protein